MTFGYYAVKYSYPSLADDSVIIFASYRDPALAGSVMQFMCKDGFFPRDVFTAMCLRNGRWFPDPTKHNCTLGTWYISHILSTITYIVVMRHTIPKY